MKLYYLQKTPWRSFKHRLCVKAFLALEGRLNYFACRRHVTATVCLQKTSERYALYKIPVKALLSIEDTNKIFYLYIYIDILDFFYQKNTCARAFRLCKTRVWSSIYTMTVEALLPIEDKLNHFYV